MPKAKPPARKAASKGRKASAVQPLLIAVDFSPPSRVALEAGRTLAKDLGAPVVLVHVSPEVADARKRKPAGRRKEQVDEALDDARRLTAEWAEDLRRDGLSVDVALPATLTWPVDGILAEAKKRSCAAIVLGTTGRGQFRQFFLGSVAQAVLQRSRIPVLVAPARMAQRKEPAPAARSILAAVDFSSDSEAAFEAAVGLAKDLKCVVRALHVIPLPLPTAPFPLGAEYSAAWLAEQEDQAAEALAQMASGARGSKVGVVPSIQVGHPATAILASARDTGAALIVVGTHGKSRARRFFLGSVAQAVVQFADRPVLVVPDPKAPAPGDWRA